jgi:flagellar biosynthesis GTPase FlhF
MEITIRTAHHFFVDTVGHDDHDKKNVATTNVLVEAVNVSFVCSNVSTRPQS